MNECVLKWLKFTLTAANAQLSTNMNNYKSSTTLATDEKKVKLLLKSPCQTCIITFIISYGNDSPILKAFLKTRIFLNVFFSLFSK